MPSTVALNVRHLGLMSDFERSEESADPSLSPTRHAAPVEDEGGHDMAWMQATETRERNHGHD